jgi:hypothetical protein
VTEDGLKALQVEYGRRLSLVACEGMGKNALSGPAWEDFVTSPKIRRESSLWSASDENDGLDEGGVVTFFDWDDTLLPTTAIAAERGWDGRATEEEVPALTAHSKLVHDLLRRARRVGRVAIVTLGKRPWVQVTCERYLLGVDWKTVFQELGIVVVYAQEVLNKGGRQYVTREGGVNLWIASKTIAMAKALKRLKVADSGPLNVVGVGDSVIEVEAAEEVVWRRSYKQGEACWCKTLQLKDEPATIEELSSQLEETLKWYDNMVRYPRDLRLTMADLDKEDNPLRSMDLAAEPPRSLEPGRKCSWSLLCRSFCPLGRSERDPATEPKDA